MRTFDWTSKLDGVTVLCSVERRAAEHLLVRGRCRHRAALLRTNRQSERRARWSLVRGALAIHAPARHGELLTDGRPRAVGRHNVSLRAPTCSASGRRGR